MAKIVLRSYKEENIRRRRIKAIYIFISIPLVAIILLFGFKTLTMFVNAGNSVSSFQENQFTKSVENADNQKVVNIIQPWLAYYNSGTARIGDGKYLDGIKDLKKALELNNGALPTECYIRANLAIGYEKQGDAYAEDGDKAKAGGYYTLGKQTIEQAPADCFPPSSGSGDDQEDEAASSMDETEKRIEDKQGGSGEDDGDGTPPDGTENPKPLTPEEQVEERTKQTQEDREAKESQERGKEGGTEPGGGAEKVSKPW